MIIDVGRGKGCGLKEILYNSTRACNVMSVDAETVGGPGISVVIPLFNKAPYIDACIGSVLIQDHSPLDVIVVDDGSTDVGPDIVAARSDSRIKLIRQTNMGVSAARNAGVAASKYELVALLDADDWWHPGHLRNLAELVNRYPDCGLFANAYEMLNGSALRRFQIGEQEQVYSATSYLQSVLNGRDPVWTSATLVKKRIFNEMGGFLKGYSHGEDHALWLRFAMYANIVVSSFLGATYRRNADSLTARLVRVPDASMVTVDSLLVSRVGLAEDIRTLLGELKNRFALSHAFNALLHDEVNIARSFLEASRSTHRYRVKLLVLRFLCFLNIDLRRIAFKILGRIRR